jgi:hypothetical protein
MNQVQLYLYIQGIMFREKKYVVPTNPFSGIASSGDSGAIGSNKKSISSFEICDSRKTVDRAVDVCSSFFFLWQFHN